MVGCLIKRKGERHLEWGTREAFRISFTIPRPKLFRLLMLCLLNTFVRRLCWILKSDWSIRNSTVVIFWITRRPLCVTGRCYGQRSDRRLWISGRSWKKSREWRRMRTGTSKSVFPKKSRVPRRLPSPSAEMFKINVNYYTTAKQAYLKKATGLMLLWTKLKP